MLKTFKTKRKNAIKSPSDLKKQCLKQINYARGKLYLPCLYLVRASVKKYKYSLKLYLTTSLSPKINDTNGGQFDIL